MTSSSTLSPREGAPPSAPNARAAPARAAELGRDTLRAATAVRLPYRDRLRYWIYHLLLARRGEMVHSELFDAQYADGRLRRGYERYLERLNARLERRGLHAGPGAFIQPPSFAPGELGDREMDLLLKRNVPFVIRGGAKHLAAMDWTLDSFDELAGDCDVPINEATDRPSDDHSRPTKSDAYYQFRTGKLREVVASIKRGGPARISSAEDVMHVAGGRLRDELDVAFWERLGGWERHKEHWLRSRFLVGRVVGAQLMMQPEHAITVWHAEPGGNFFALFKGVKTWTLIHPLYTAAMRPRVKKTTNYFGCNIDVREPDDVQRERGFGGYVAVPKVRVTIGPGDVLRVPNHWWHTAVTHAEGYALAGTIRCECMPNLVGPGYMFLRWMDEQFHAIVKAYAAEGRIKDEHIGYPRRSRSAGRS